MNLFTRQGRTPFMAAVAVIAAFFASGAFAQDADTAYVPFVVNVAATVKAEFDPGDAAASVAPVQITVMGGAEAFMRIPIQKTIGVTYTAPKLANAPALVTNRGGKITVNLPAQSYRTAEIALYTVNGKRILRGKASAASAVNSISRPNVATGAYLLSIKGTDGRAATTRLTHSGGDLNINVSFGGETPLSPSTERLSKKAAAGDWTITVSAAGYFDSVYTLSLKAGMNAGQNITLRETPPSGYVVAVASEGAGATGGGSYVAGATVSISAGTPPDGKVFKHWTSANASVIFADANSASTMFIMPGSAVTVTANFEAASTAAPTFAVAVSAGMGATGGGNYAAGATVSISAGTAPAGQQFKNWTSTNSSVIFADANSSATTFVMPGSAATVTAVFEAVPTPTPATYPATVSSTGAGATGGGNYAAGATVSISAGTAPSGYAFDKWTSASAGVTFANANSAATTFTMPPNAATVTANFVTIKYKVTVSSAGTGASGGGDYVPGMTVSISAGTPPVGQVFKNWTSADGVTFANANSAATTFTMPTKAVTVTANFGLATFTDARDNKVYKTVTVGGKKWMAENLNYATSSGSWCYGDDNSKCAEYGRMYDWNTALSACPSGWHLPSRDEWGALAKAVGGTGDYGAGGTAGKKLKAANGWDNNGNGTDDYGFSGLPGGVRAYVGDGFDNVGNTGYWWTATEGSRLANGGSAYNRRMFHNEDNVGEDDGNKFYSFSVRCVEGVQFAVTVSNGTGSGSYAAGATVSIAAGTAPTGQVFKNWTSADGVTFANANNAATTFTMPTKAVTVTANFETPFKTVTIGGKTWMAENLNVATENSRCYNNSADSCAKYGRLYTWDAAMTACPAGWHLPTRDEWGALAKAAGGTGDYGDGGTAGKKLKAASGWGNGNGTDDYGFSALPGGFDHGAGFESAGSRGYWWTASYNSEIDRAYYRRMEDLSDNVPEYDISKFQGYSVRCLAD